MKARSGDAEGLLPFAVEATAHFWPTVRQAARVAIDDRPVSPSKETRGHFISGMLAARYLN